MAVGDILIDAIILLLQKTILAVLPYEISFLKISTFTNLLTSVKTNFIYSLSGISKIMPIDLLFACVLTIITAELLLFSVKAGFWLINVIRGSGA